MAYENIVIPANVNIQGTATFSAVQLPASSVSNTNIATPASGSAIAAAKLTHDHRRGYAQESATAAADESRVIYRGIAAAGGTVLKFVAGAVTKAIGDATCTVDLKKNGTTVLSAPISLSSADTNRVALAGTISTPSYAAGDVFEVVIDGTIGTGTLPKGVFAEGQFVEEVA